MSENNKSINGENLSIFGNPKILTASALMVALSIVCGKLLAFNVGTILRFSFENLPILLTSVAFGPVAGIFVAVCADLIGCLIVGYEINPLVTLGAALIGLVGGLLYKLCKRLPELARIIISVVSAHLIGSVVVKTFGLSRFYEISFGLLLAWRALNYAIIGALEVLLLYYVFKSKAVKNQLDRIKRK